MMQCVKWLTMLSFISPPPLNFKEWSFLNFHNFFILSFLPHEMKKFEKPTNNPKWQGLIFFSISHPLLNVNFYNMISYNVKIFSVIEGLL